LCCVFSLVYMLFHCNHALLVVISRVFHCNQKLSCSVNQNPWEGNPFNHSKPKPLGKINHSKPKNWTQKPNTDPYTYTAKLFPFTIVAITSKNYHCHSKESLFFSQAEGALRAHFLPNLFARQPIHRKPQPLHFFHKPNTANLYTANPNPFSQKSGLLCFFHRNQTNWKKHSKLMLCFSTRCDFPSLLLICVSCVLCISCALLAWCVCVDDDALMMLRWWWKGELISVEILTVKRPVDVDDAAE